MTRPDATGERRRLFIEELRARGTIYHAARAAGIDRRTAYRWRDASKVFAEEWANALEDSTEILEDSVYQRALKDSLLAMFVLKARRPEMYRDKPPVAIDANAVGGVQIYLPEQRKAEA